MGSELPAERGETLNVPYREAVGTLLRRSLGTRPDICYTVSQVAKFNDCFRIDHWNAVKRIFRYLKKTMRMGLRFMSIHCDRRKFKTYVEIEFVDSLQLGKLRFANGEYAPILGYGQVNMFQGVLHVEILDADSVLSVGLLTTFLAHKGKIGK